jgi:hypothetical protein
MLVRRIASSLMSMCGSSCPEFRLPVGATKRLHLDFLRKRRGSSCHDRAHHSDGYCRLVASLIIRSSWGDQLCACPIVSFIAFGIFKQMGVFPMTVGGPIIRGESRNRAKVSRVQTKFRRGPERAGKSYLIENKIDTGCTVFCTGGA